MLDWRGRSARRRECRRELLLPIETHAHYTTNNNNNNNNNSIEYFVMYTLGSTQVSYAGDDSVNDERAKETFGSNARTCH
jgi:hypothetical protein